jgi:hypothetical protein
MFCNHDDASQSAAYIAVLRWNAPTSFTAGYVVYSYTVGHNSIIWFRIQDDGTNRISSISTDGIHWVPFHTVGRTDFLTPDQVGIEAHTENTSLGFYCTLLSWAVS